MCVGTFCTGMISCMQSTLKVESNSLIFRCTESWTFVKSYESRSLLVPVDYFIFEFGDWVDQHKICESVGKFRCIEKYGCCGFWGDGNAKLTRSQPLGNYFLAQCVP